MALHGSQKRKICITEGNKSTERFRMHSANVSNLMAISVTGRERKIVSGPPLVYSSMVLQWPECFFGMLLQWDV